ncbi:hypothetical protein ACFMQL_31125 [Nonomuraea fastidiosa]|jgi:cytochrome P450|uniref:hypothetical protein n=1 Tax=Nonomuraea TaxID=83681 RepID=UPI003255C700
MAPPRHTRYRRLLTGEFTVRRMRRLTERIEEVTRARLDAMERHGPPIDVVEACTAPIPAAVICAPLGVPEQDRAGFVAEMARPIGPELGASGSCRSARRAWTNSPSPGDH